MKNNYITLIENKEEVKYKILMDIKDLNNKSYYIYTKNEKEDKDIITYVSEYHYTNGKLILNNDVSDEDFKLIKDILNSIQKGSM